MLDKKYNHLEVEENKYEKWKKYFSEHDISKKPYSIVIPPPNVTGKLHLGHAWDTTLQDIIIRYKKLKGFDTLFLPGMDHAGIATQAKIDERLRNEGIKPREMDREEWLKKAWSWKEEYALIIREQWSKLGIALDYTKERFTLDEGLNKAVTKVFIDYYNKGLIYRGKRIINWDPKAQTALSNLEVIYKDIKGAFYHIKYMLEDGSYLEIATTRPETMFGDTALAVNIKDERYKKYVGKEVLIPIINKKIPVITDIHADMEFGTGVVKITPAHDPNDYLVGERNNLEKVVCMNKDATMNENAGKYEGMDRFACRKQLVIDLEKEGLLIDVKEHIHSVGHSERTGVIVEPYLSEQWFVKMEELSKKALNEHDVEFIPERFKPIFNAWMENVYDWCISRQLWWGHKIPAWYKDDEIKVQVESPGEGWHQDEDVLDTWFSSALWPFSTFGWPDETDDFKRYFPTNILVTAYDIIFFWVSRMIFQSLELTSKSPFDKVLIHGLIRDDKGRKMSKSLGNGVDPMKVIESYGADALRFFLTTNSAPGQDLRYDEDKVKASWNFVNKLWNSTRFVLMNLEGYTGEKLEIKTLEDKWIISKLNRTIKSVTINMDKNEFAIAGNELYDFFWHDFCDWYIELSKVNPNKSVLYRVLLDIIKMLHPFIPFVTEELYQMLPIKDKESIMIEEYPLFDEIVVDDISEESMNKTIEAIKKIRTFILENKLTKEAEYEFIGEISDDVASIIKRSLNIKEGITANNDESIVLETPILSINIAYKINKEEQISNLEKEINNLEASISKREKLLANEKYVNNAPKVVVDKDKVKLEEEKEYIDKLNEQLCKLKDTK